MFRGWRSQLVPLLLKRSQFIKLLFGHLDEGIIIIGGNTIRDEGRGMRGIDAEELLVPIEGLTVNRVYKEELPIGRDLLIIIEALHSDV